jgi:DNA-binding LytR/AlgR family response regulator
MAAERSPHESQPRPSQAVHVVAAWCDDEQLARRSCVTSSNSSASRSGGAGGNGVEALARVDVTSRTSSSSTSRCPADGFEVARRLLAREDDAPALVFVTAFDQHAIEAFEVNAVDYLLKPVEAARLEQALQRAAPADLGASGAGAPLNDQLERIVKMMSDRRSTGNRWR